MMGLGSFGMIGRGRGIGAVALAGAAALALLAAPVPVRAQGAPAGAPVQLQIAPQPLDTALTTFADKVGLKLLFASRDVGGLRTPGLSGSFTPAEGLSRLLAGTGMTYRFVDATTVTLEKLPPTGSSGPVTLGPIAVEAGAVAERATGPVQGYVAHQSATAAKTDTPLLETPQAVSVVGRQQVQAQNAQSLVDVLHYTPGTQAGHNPVDNRFDSIRIRGFEPTLFLDGLQLPYGAGLFGRPKVDPFGLERIEVLRGPSSSLYGQVAPGGLVNMVSLRPPADPTHMVQLQGSSFGQLQGSVDLGGPVDRDGTLLYRLTALAHDGGTQIDHVDDQRVMIAPAFTWRPDPDTSFTFLSQYQRDDGGVQIQFLPAQGTLLPNPNGQVPVGRFLGEPDFDRYKRTQYWVGYQFERRFDETWAVRQNLRYAHLDTDLSAVIGGGLQSDLRSLNRQTFYVPEKAQNVAVDNQAEANFATGQLAHKLLFGVDYRWDDSRFRRGIGAAPTLDIFAPAYGASVVPPAVATDTGQSQHQVGVYLQDQIALDRWRLTLSGRHDWVDTTTRNFIAGSDRDQSTDAFSGRAGLSYVLDLGLAPYVSYARSFQPVLGTAFDGSPFKPTTGDQYEVGIKYQPPGTSLAVNAALFTLTQQNALTADPARPTFSVQTGETRSRGIELDATASLADGLNLLAAYTYTDAEVTKSNGADLGKQVITVPKHQASLWLDYTLGEGPYRGLGFGGGIRYFGETYGNAANTLLIPDYTLVDAALHYDLGELAPSMQGARLALNATNLFDRRYVATCTSTAACYYGSARLVTVGLSYSW